MKWIGAALCSDECTVGGCQRAFQSSPKEVLHLQLDIITGALKKVARQNLQNSFRRWFAPTGKIALAARM
jgi:hypothetical protein